MRRFVPFLTVLALACIQGERNINRSIVQGTVLVEGTRVEETDFPNQKPRGAQPFGPLLWSINALDGAIDAWGTTEEGDLDDTVADVDYYRFTSEVDLPEHELTLLVDAAGACTIRFLVQLPDEETEDEDDYLDVQVDDIEVVAGASEHTLTMEIEAGVEYFIALGGLEGSGAAAYTLAVPAQDPDDARILVGAYRSDDPTSRKPVGGASVRPFTIDESWSYVGEWELIDLRGVFYQDNPMNDVVPEDYWPVWGLEEGGQVIRVEENIARVWLMAGDWANVNGALPAGTWYTSTPIRIDVKQGTYVVEEPLVLDTFAPLVIGQEFVESEPNDIVADINTGLQDISDPDLMNDLGVLSGPGYVDIVTGDIPFVDANPSWDHDVDAFRFQVPVASYISVTVEWPNDATDLDFLVSDEAGDQIDRGYYNHPETSDYQPLYEPEKTYFLSIIGYLGDPAVPEPYTLKLEQVPGG